MTPDAIARLESNGCSATDWNNVTIHPEADLSLIKNVAFSGRVTIGRVEAAAGPLAGIANAAIADCVIDDYPSIRNIGGIISGVRIGKNVTIANIGSVVMEPEASCGVATAVAVLDETGSRPVYIYPGMSAQTAGMMALFPAWTEDHFLPMLNDKIEAGLWECDVEDGAVVTDCQTLRNVHIGREVRVTGALSLVDGAIVNNAPDGKCMAFVGPGVDACGFIVEDGIVDSGALLRNVYVGQGAQLEKRFTAHDSLFFANSSMENGEACAIFAAPYSVSMHKSSLLIASAASFMNAGSGTNFSNHMYKLGPVHWGLMDRGVKTASNSYVMWGAHIGAYSLVMGNHKTHPDTSALPFSYLFGSEKGDTIVAPGQMLKSCGLVRDAQKWPKRDRRIKRRLPLYDNITFEVLNPFTIQNVIKGLEILETLIDVAPDADGLVRYDKLALRPSAVKSGLHLYKLALLRYLYEKSHEEGYADVTLPATGIVPSRWIDLAGQVMPRSVLERAFTASSVDELTGIFADAAQRYSSLEHLWVKSLVEGQFKSLMPEAPGAILELSEYLDADRRSYKASLAAENEMLGL